MIEIFKITHNIVFAWLVLMISILITPYIGFGGWLWNQTSLDGYHKLLRCRPYKIASIIIIVALWIYQWNIPASHIVNYCFYLSYGGSIFLWLQSIILYRLRKQHKF